MAVTWETVRHQVAIAGVVSNAQTQEKMRGVVVKIEDGPAEFLQWLNLQKKTISGYLVQDDGATGSNHDLGRWTVLFFRFA
jgi:predicted RNA binding protein with dsRBD fold (UPF0201 family)